MNSFASVAIVALLLPAPAKNPLDLNGLLRASSDGRVITARYDADLGSLTRTYWNPQSPTRHARMASFYQAWTRALQAHRAKLPTEADQAEFDTLEKRIAGEVRLLRLRVARQRELSPLLPFAPTISQFEDTRRAIAVAEPIPSAEAVNTIARQITKLRTAIDQSFERGEGRLGNLLLTKTNLYAAADSASQWNESLKRWYRYYEGYDPLFSWWVSQPYQEATAELDRYVGYLRNLAEAMPADEPVRAVISASVLPAGKIVDLPDLAAILTEPRSEFLPVLQRYQVDRRDRRDATEWLFALERMDVSGLSMSARVDYQLLRNSLHQAAKRRELSQLPQLPRVRDESGIDGRPIGREALLAELKGEMIAYTPEELIAIAEKEYEWCQVEVRKAAKEMGYTNWRDAVEAVKRKHVDPGKQTYLVRDLAREAIDYLRIHRLVTVPTLAEETWRMEMMSAEAQRFNPFFTGGEVITVAFPTQAMSHEAKMQSLRGNNIHFSRATVQHELIPGHALQWFQNARHQPHRQMFATPLWIEGWAMYWEMVLYARGDFAKTPEDRIGFLVWRMHRCSRVVFSFRFHLGQMKPQQCVDYLVEKVGFEPANAAAEVRRSFGGAYGPVYQAAYLIGALQFWSLRKELVDSGIMAEKAFHDQILQQNRIPIELVRAILKNDPLGKRWQPGWRFMDEKK